MRFEESATPSVGLFQHMTNTSPKSFTGSYGGVDWCEFDAASMLESVAGIPTAADHETYFMVSGQ